jgi:ubiquinone biosynthesis protein Coq4
MHDLFHVITGRNTNPSDEGALLWFSQAQLGGGANLFLSLGATLELIHVWGLGWIGEVRRSWREGRRARWLVTLPFEELLPLSLETVRGMAGVGQADRVRRVRLGLR